MTYASFHCDDYSANNLPETVSVCLRLTKNLKVTGQQFQQGTPNTPLPSQLYLLLWDHPVLFPGQLRCIVSPACPGSPPIDAWNTPPGRHHDQMLQTVPLNVEERWLNFEPLLDVWTLYSRLSPATHHSQGPAPSPPYCDWGPWPQSVAVMAVASQEITLHYFFLEFSTIAVQHELEFSCSSTLRSS